MGLISRRRIPQIFVAYGDLGHLWLSELRSRLRAHESLDQMVEAQVIQLWCFGVAGDARNDIATWESVPAVSELSQRLDAARMSRNVTRFPGLEMLTLRFIERISLFGTVAASLRPAFKSRLDDLPDRAATGSGAEHGFRVEWIALADSIHDPRSLDKHGKKNARALLAAAGDDTLTLLVDREDERLAIQDEAAASGCLLELAMAYAQSDIGAPRNDGVSAQAPDVTQTPTAKTVVPFSVVVLEYPKRRVDDARSDAMKRALAGGMSDVSARLSAFKAKPPLQDALREDRKSLDANRYDRFERSQARREAASETVAFMFASGDMRWMRNYLVEIRREAVALDAGFVESSFPALAAFALLQSDTTPTSIPAPLDSAALQLGVLGVTVTAAVAALILIRRARRRAEAEVHEPEFDERRTTPELRREVRQQWESLCDDLTELFDAWEHVKRKLEATGRTSELNQSAWTPAPPLGQRLTDELAANATSFAVTPELCRSAARFTFEQVESAAKAGDAIDHACRRVLIEGEQAVNRGPGIVERILETALSDPHDVAISEYVRQRPYLIKSRSRLQREAIVWLTASTTTLAQQFGHLEEAASRSVLHLLSHDDTERTVRLAFAKAVPWNDVHSLSLDRSNV